jgi:predicted dehydrogenase
VTKIRFGIVGLVHDHLWPVWGEGYLNQLKKCKEVEIVAAADGNQYLREKIEKEFGISRVYPSFEELIKREEIDAVMLSLPNDERADATEMAASLNLHVITDKPMAATLDQAERMLNIQKATNIKMLIDWPSAWTPGLHKANSLVEQGVIGNVFQLRLRLGNPGPEYHGCTEYFLEWLFNEKKSGGGVLIDGCCYGANVCRWFMGYPKAVIGLGGRYVKDNISAEDNAIILMEYPKAMGIAEGSWSQYSADTPGSLYPSNGQVVIYGSKGAIVVDKVNHVEPNPIILISEQNQRGEVIEVPPLPRGQRNGPEYFVHCLLNNEPVRGMCSPEIGRDVQEIIEAAYRSMKEGKKIDL